MFPRYFAVHLSWIHYISAPASYVSFLSFFAKYLILKNIVSEIVFNQTKLLKEQEWGNDVVQSVHFCNLIDEAMGLYKLRFHRKKKQRKQRPIAMIFTPRTKQPASPATAPPRSKSEV